MAHLGRQPEHSCDLSEHKQGSHIRAKWVKALYIPTSSMFSYQLVLVSVSGACFRSLKQHRISTFSDTPLEQLQGEQIWVWLHHAAFSAFLPDRTGEQAGWWELQPFTSFFGKLETFFDWVHRERFGESFFTQDKVTEALAGCAFCSAATCKHTCILLLASCLCSKLDWIRLISGKKKAESIWESQSPAILACDSAI